MPTGACSVPDPPLTGRFAARAESDLRRELLIEPWAELGLIALDGPNDPDPELVVEDGVVVRLDGRSADKFDVIDRFLVAHGLDLEVAAEAMALGDQALARMLVDIDVPRAELVRLARGLTPAKLARVVTQLDPVELMLALKKLRARRDPGNQAHVTNLKENPALLAAWLDLEVASGNDAIASHSPIRKTAKLMGQFLPGTDFVTSGYSVMPRRDNTFGGGNYDADDIDEWLTLQRDWQIDAGIEPVTEEEIVRVRSRAARAIQVVFEELGLPAVTDAEVELATTAHGSAEVPDRDRAADVEAADRLLASGASALDVALALERRGFGDVGEAVFAMLRQRVAADYLQTSAVIEPDGLVRSAVNDPNVYGGPGTGYRLSGERWALLQALPHVIDPRELGTGAGVGADGLLELGDAALGTAANEIVIAVGPAFLADLTETINGLPHAAVLDAIVDGVGEAGGAPRVIRVRRSSDVAFIAHDGAKLSGSGIALGIQSKGTAVIHRADLEPLDNLELFGMSPLYSLDSYRAMGRNAAGYALGESVGPVPTELDNFARAKLIVRTTLLHARETRAVTPGAAARELRLVRQEAPH